MSVASWKSEYLTALVNGDYETSAKYEVVEFANSVLNTESNGVSELLLHRVIARLMSLEETLDLLAIASESGWNSYLPRILARIPDIGRTRLAHPEYGNHIDHALRVDKSHTTYTTRDWVLITNELSVKYDRNSVWSRKMTDVAEILGTVQPESISDKDLQQILEFYFAADTRIFQLAVVTFSAQSPNWAETLRSVIVVPNIHVRVVPTRSLQGGRQYSPRQPWAPHWLLSMQDVRNHGWTYYETQTQVAIRGQGNRGIREQITILLSLSALLRDGTMLQPVEGWSPFPPKEHPIWGFPDRQYSASGTGMQADDVRALALSFLERVSGSFPISAFRSRLAAHFLVVPWKSWKNAAILTAEDGFFRDVVDIANLYTANDFAAVIGRVEMSDYSNEPILEYFYNEAVAGIALLHEASGITPISESSRIRYPQRVLCVAHASVPHQNGGYAIRAHGILKQLRMQGVEISAVTRPGFPGGPQAVPVTEVVDNVEYLRLPETGVAREEGEIQHMLSFVEPFERIFSELGVGKIHVRSTYLIALPALLAARRLGLKVLYEVSGLWDLVYQDRENYSELFKRSSFAHLAESVVMRNSDRVVVMNDELKNIVVQRGADDARVSIAHNAVDTEEFQLVQTAPSDLCTVGYIGSFVSYEGLGYLVDALKILNNSGSPVRLVAVGDGTQFEAIRKKVENEGLSHLIDLPGRVPHKKVKDYYQDIDIMVYPRVSTGTTEAITPLKPFEGLALGKPIIVSDVAPLVEIVGDQERGLIFKNKDAEDLARTIKLLSGDLQLQLSLGLAGREWVVKNRNWNKVVRVFTEAYKRLDDVPVS